MNTLLKIFVAAALLTLSPLSFATDININTASAGELAAELKGVGLSKAKAIVLYREQHGLFSSPDELSGVKGIGLRTIDMNRESIKVEVPEEK
ncbi:MAG: ComEA family DNA-binding protein [Gammaproteobacteria bacterium]